MKAMTEQNAENQTEAPQLEKELDADPASTYGASPQYKAAWHEKFGGDAPFDAPTAGDSTPVSDDGTSQAPAAGADAPANAGVNDNPDAAPADAAPVDPSAAEQVAADPNAQGKGQPKR